MLSYNKISYCVCACSSANEMNSVCELATKIHSSVFPIIIRLVSEHVDGQLRLCFPAVLVVRCGRVPEFLPVEVMCATCVPET